MSNSTVSKLDDFAGLSSAKRLVRRIAAGDTGVHSLLFYGARGSGKTAMARLVAQAWLCMNPGPDGADGTCRACGAFDRGLCADFLLIAPTGSSSNIRNSAIVPGTEKDAPVPLSEFFRSMPLMARHKVTIIEQAHRMNSAAFNALLKTLEEPLPHAKLILTTDSISRIPPTIASRCLGVACELPSGDEVKQMYPKATDCDLLISEGAPGRTLQVLEHAERYRAVCEFAQLLRDRDKRSALACAEEFRAICDSLESAVGLGARAAQAEALESLATVFARSGEFNPEWSQRTLEAHRRIVGNASATLVLDALFTCLLV